MKWKWMEAEEDAIKPEPELTDALKLIIALTAAAAAAAPLMSLLFTLRSSFRVEPYCAASFWSIVYHSLDFLWAPSFAALVSQARLKRKLVWPSFKKDLIGIKEKANGNDKSRRWTSRMSPTSSDKCTAFRQPAFLLPIVSDSHKECMISGQ